MTSEKKISTQTARALLDQIMHTSPRERQLLDRRDIDADDNPAILAEINELRAARGKPPYDPPNPN